LTCRSMPTDTLVISFPTSFFQFKFLSKIRFFSSRITANVLGIAEGGEFEAESFDFAPRRAKTNFYELNLKIKNE
ncbi:hypothetical protein PG618_09830, partial [Riemerella anatipestifer]|nr:hypothetical protein [Riemerella anatipestifer]